MPFLNTAKNCFSGPVHDPWWKWLLCEPVRLAGRHGRQPRRHPVLQTTRRQRLCQEHGHKHCPWQVWKHILCGLKRAVGVLPSLVTLTQLFFYKLWLQPRLWRHSTVSHSDSSAATKAARSHTHSSHLHVYSLPINIARLCNTRGE